MACACPSANLYAGGSRPTPPTIGADGFHVGGALIYPAAFDSRKTYPLVVFLHGRGDTGTSLITELGMTELQNMDGGVIIWAPTGGTDTAGTGAPTTAWDASVACCWFDASPANDHQYIATGITTIQGTHRIDPNKIWLIGHSTGAFLAHRVAVEHADLICGIIGISGYFPSRDGTGFIPSRAVHVTIVTPTVDTIVLSAGSAAPVPPEVPDAPYPGAATSAGYWHSLNGGSSSLAAFGVATDFDSGAGAGNETTFERYAVQPANGTVELWTMTGSTHLPTFTAGTRITWRDAVMARLKTMVRV